MFSARYRRALACFFISALVFADMASGEVPADVLRAAELEAGLAAGRDVYLVVDIESRALFIRVRGVTLESFAIDSVVAYERRRLTEARGVTPLEVPRVFTTAATIGLVDRTVVAPSSLRPWGDEGETSRTARKSDPRPAAPSLYDVPFDEGWILEIRQERLTFARSSAVFSAFADGWARLTRSETRDRRPTIRIVMDETAAKKVHHLFKKGATVLLVLREAEKERSRVRP